MIKDYEDMKAKQFLKGKGICPTEPIYLAQETHKKVSLDELLEEYHQDKLKLMSVSSDVSDCDHKGTTIAWGETEDKCIKCELTWDINSL